MCEIYPAFLCKTKLKWLHLNRTGADSVAVFDKDNSVIKVYGSRFVDTGGGFLLEEKVGEPEEQVHHNTCNFSVS